MVFQERGLKGSIPLKRNRQTADYERELAVQFPCLLRCKTHIAGGIRLFSVACTVVEPMGKVVDILLKFAVTALPKARINSF